MSAEIDLPTSIDSLFKAPPGTKIWLLNLGSMEVDMAFMLRGANGSSHSNPHPKHERRALIMISILISHPTEGLILFETGAGHDYPNVLGPPSNDVFNRVNYSPQQELPAAIAATGNSISDVKAVILGHLHLDHAGGLESFHGTDVPIYVHEIELKHAYHTMATRSDPGVYLPHYMDINLKWHTWSGSSLEFATGIKLYLAPGHTPGLSIMLVNMPESGSWVITSDMYHVKENWEEGIPQGWLLRDHNAWMHSHQKIKSLVKRTNAKIILGHDAEYFLKYQKEGGEFYL